VARLRGFAPIMARAAFLANLRISHGAFDSVAACMMIAATDRSKSEGKRA